MFGDLSDVYITADIYEVVPEIKQIPIDPLENEVIKGYNIPVGSLINVTTKNSELHIKAVPDLDFTFDDDDFSLYMTTKHIEY
ncbi:MAG: hypothetical protein QW533_07345 [Thermoplasmata archaeon]